MDLDQIWQHRVFAPDGAETWGVKHTLHHLSPDDTQAIARLRTWSARSKAENIWYSEGFGAFLHFCRLNPKSVRCDFNLWFLRRQRKQPHPDPIELSCRHMLLFLHVGLDLEVSLLFVCFWSNEMEKLNKLTRRGGPSGRLCSTYILLHEMLEGWK